MIQAAEHSERTLGRFRTANHRGRLAGDDVVTGRAGELRQGRAVAVDLRLSQGTVIEARFRAYGCPATIAAADLLCERSEGQLTGKALEIPVAGLERELGLTAERRGCILIAQDALRAALSAPKEGS
jgi:NifU-like protein involved in Fe-S cluster formation